MGPNSPAEISLGHQKGLMKLTIPDWHVVLLHELHLAIVHSTNVALLFFCTLESTDSVREPKTTVVMDGVYRVVPYSVEACEVHAESVSRLSSVRLQKIDSSG